MALHVCRDFLTIGNPLNLSMPYICLYYQAMFLRTVLGFTVVGQTNFNIDGSTLRKGFGVNGSLNQGSSDVYAFSPNGYTVSAADINRILAVKSPANGRVNSGLFRITSVDTTNNWLYINYRSGDIPPPETGMTWAVYADETVFNSSLNYSGNGIAGTYTGRGAATQSRIILQSPSPLAWQVRLSIENSTDCWNGGSGPCFINSTGVSTTPGYGGDSAGDFPVAGQHLHYPMWINSPSSQYLGTSCGLFPFNSNQARIYMWGDDLTGTTFVASRNVVGSAGTNFDSFVHFGLAEDEELPLPPKSVQRLFVIGAAGAGQNGVYWHTGRAMQRNGMSFGYSNTPISCIYSLYNTLDSSGFGGSGIGIRDSSLASDSPYIGATELLPVDLLVGTNDNVQQNTANFSTNNEILVLEGRRLGRAPFVRVGRSNYGYFQVAPDGDSAWLHLDDGIYLPWQGSILP